MSVKDHDDGDRELLRQFIGLPIPKLTAEQLEELYGEERKIK